MTQFDPKFALKVMRRRQSEKNKAAAEIHLEKFMLQMEGRISHFGGEAREFDRQVHRLWDEADSYEPVIDYLEKRIWDEKTVAEQTWALMEGGSASYGVEMVRDVFRAKQNALLGARVDTQGNVL